MQLVSNSAKYYTHAVIIILCTHLHLNMSIKQCKLCVATHNPKKLLINIKVGNCLFSKKVWLKTLLRDFRDTKKFVSNTSRKILKVSFLYFFFHIVTSNG